MYKYITDNNLINKQTYMYSEYGGVNFLCEYVKSRRIYQEIIEDSSIINEVPILDSVQQILKKSYEILKNGTYNDYTISLINIFIKNFEVRKRIYTDYTNEWKPQKEAKFDNYENYLLFADCLLYMYRYTSNLKYFSCLLKLDDTLLSIYRCLNDCQKRHLFQIISKEMEIFIELAKRYNIDMEI